ARTPGENGAARAHAKNNSARSLRVWKQMDTDGSLLRRFRGRLDGARPRESILHLSVVALVTRVLVQIFRVLIILIIRAPGKHIRPRFRPRRRIVDRDGFIDRLLIDAREALDVMHVPLLGAADPGLLPRIEVRPVNDQGVALPAAARGPVPSPDTPR